MKVPEQVPLSLKPPWACPKLLGVIEAETSVKPSRTAEDAASLSRFKQARVVRKIFDDAA